VLADDAVLVSDGQAALAKSRVVEAHQPGKGPKFTHVEMSEMTIVDHGTAAVVTCQGTYEGPQTSVYVEIHARVVKKNGRWQIVAGSISR